MISKKAARPYRTALLKRRNLILITLLFVGVYLFPFSAHAFDIQLGTGAPGTFSHFSGRMLCRAINSQMDDLNCQVAPTPDDVDNLTNLRGGSLDIGIVDSRLLIDAVNKTGHFQYLDISYENLRAIAPLYDTPISLVVRDDAGIASLEDLKGKRINAGAPQGIQSLAVNTIMEAKSWTKKNFSIVGELPPSQSQDTMAFCHGTMQAMVHIGVHPDSSLQQLFKLCQAKLVNMDDANIQKMVGRHPAFWKIGIKANTYPTQMEEVITFGTRAMLVASEDLDAETVYKIMDAIGNNQKRLTSAHSALSLFSTSAAKEEIKGVERHPGAVKYFSEE